jgi:putative ABC transport system substrate-binding protein
VIVGPLTITLDSRVQIANLAQKNRLPAMYGGRAFMDAGALMAYGSSLSDRWRRAATFVDKILKGAKPGGLPVEQPTKFELRNRQSEDREGAGAHDASFCCCADEVIQ